MAPLRMGSGRRNGRQVRTEIYVVDIYQYTQYHICVCTRIIHRRQEAASSRQEARGRRQEAGGRRQETGDSEQAAGSRQQAANSSWQRTNSRQQTRMTTHL
jgi:hypothetical protein